jgi:hypothetical protein
LQIMVAELWNPEQNGALTEAALKRKLEARGFAVTRYVYYPGTYFPDHTHGVDEIDGFRGGGGRRLPGGTSRHGTQRGGRR